MMKRLWALGTVAALSATAFSLPLPSSSATSMPAVQTPSNSIKATPKPNIWYVNPLFSYPLWLTSSNYFKSHAAADGYKATVVGEEQLSDTGTISQIDEAVAAGAQGIITCDLDPATFKSTILSAEKKGVVVVSIGCVDNDSDYSVGTNNTQWGTQSAQVIEQHVGPNAEIGAIGTNLSTPNQAQAYHAFVGYLKRHYPKMKVVATEFDNSDPTKAASEATSMVIAYPKIRAIWLFEGFAPSVMPRALAEAGRKPGQIFVLGVDALPATESAIKSGWVSETLAQCWFWAGPFAAQLIKAKLGGHGPTTKFFPVKLYPVTKKNIPFPGCPASAYPTLPKS